MFPALLACLVATASAGSARWVAVTDASGSGLVPSAPLDPAALPRAGAEWARDSVGRAGTDDERAEALLRALSDRGLTPEGATTTGAGVFATGRYNCLSLSLLLVPALREVGVDARYVRVRALTEPLDLGTTVVSSTHVAAAFGDHGRPKVVDPVPTTPEELRGATWLTDAEAVGLYHVNRGAEALLAGRAEDALAWFDLAEAVAPTLPELWVDRGVALGRLGRADEARDAQLRALSLDPWHGPAWRNLAAMLAAGDPDAARVTLEGLEGKVRRDPLTLLAVGDAWAAVGEPQRALRSYRAAWLAGGRTVGLRAARADALWNTGRQGRARRVLAAAEAIDAEHPRVAAARARARARARSE